MKLDSYRCLISNLPIRQQAFTSQLTTWSKRMEPLPAALEDIFGGNQEVTLSRDDLFSLAGARAIPRIVYAVILWGYPKGMRGNHFPNIVGAMAQIEAILTEIRQDGNQIPDWDEHWNNTFGQANGENRVAGLGLSTYSKILYFMNTRANGKKCLILDQVLIDVFSSRKFDEFAHLAGITYTTAPNLYPTYIASMVSESLRLGVTPDQLEMFLFMFGSVLK